MAIPKRLKEITKENALSIIKKHPEGSWEGAPMNSDFVYEGRMTKYGYRRLEMIRVFKGCYKETYEWGVCSC